MLLVRLPRRVRRHVTSLAAQLRLQHGDAVARRLVRGVTGCQKTVLLQKLRDLGAQVVDLEGAADHKGSILGVNVDAPQPSQKLFESRLADEVARFDDSRPVFIEGESSLVGQRTVPSALLHSMRKAGSLLVNVGDKLEEALVYRTSQRRPLRPQLYTLTRKT